MLDRRRGGYERNQDQRQVKRAYIRFLKEGDIAVDQQDRRRDSPILPPTRLIASAEDTPCDTPACPAMTKYCAPCWAPGMKNRPSRVAERNAGGIAAPFLRGRRSQASPPPGSVERARRGRSAPRTGWRHPARRSCADLAAWPLVPSVACSIARPAALAARKPLSLAPPACGRKRQPRRPDRPGPERRNRFPSSHAWRRAPTGEGSRPVAAADADRQRTRRQDKEVGERQRCRK